MRTHGCRDDFSPSLQLGAHRKMQRQQVGTWWKNQCTGGEQDSYNAKIRIHNTGVSVENSTTGEETETVR